MNTFYAKITKKGIHKVREFSVMMKSDLCIGTQRDSEVQTSQET